MQDRQIPSPITALRFEAPVQSPRARAHDVASRFEALFVQQMVAAMRTSAGGDDGGMFGAAAGSDTYASWFDSCMADHIGHGGGIGLATVIEKNILQHASLDAEATSNA